MFHVIGILFDLGVVASAALGVACMLRRLLVGRRTRRWIAAIQQPECDESSARPGGKPRHEAPAEIWDHVVQLYGHLDELVDAVSGYLRAAICAHEVAVVVATEAHRRAFDAALIGSGVDLVAARDDGLYIALDAAETMTRFVADGEVDGDRFRAAIGPLLRTASAGGRPVRVYGEMVALLWEAGHINAAVDLEALWNELGSVLPFSLYCAYPAHSVTSATHRADLQALCGLHGAVVGFDPSRMDAAALAFR